MQSVSGINYRCWESDPKFKVIKAYELVWDKISSDARLESPIWGESYSCVSVFGTVCLCKAGFDVTQCHLAVKDWNGERVPPRGCCFISSSRTKLLEQIYRPIVESPLSLWKWIDIWPIWHIVAASFRIQTCAVVEANTYLFGWHLNLSVDLWFYIKRRCTFLKWMYDICQILRWYGLCCNEGPGWTIWNLDVSGNKRKDIYLVTGAINLSWHQTE